MVKHIPLHWLGHKRHPISRPKGMGCLLWWFFRKLTALCIIKFSSLVTHLCNGQPPSGQFWGTLCLQQERWKEITQRNAPKINTFHTGCRIFYTSLADMSTGDIKSEWASERGRGERASLCMIHRSLIPIILDGELQQPASNQSWQKI